VPADARYYNGRPGSEMHNVYQLLYQRATFEAVAESTGHRGLVNARSGTAGMQRYPICWCGDPNCTWEDFRAALRAGLSIGLSGVPFWSCDNGGFSSKAGNLTDHLWIRWSQWSMFQSNPRLLGTSPPPRVPWSFGEQAVRVFRKYAKLRYRLMPYIYSQAHQSTQTGLPMMRAMVLEYPQDPRTHDLEDQYMFGDALLIAPVCSPDNRRSIYLPQGSWFDYWSGERLDGPLTVTVEPDLETLPIYVRADSILPMGPDMAYIGEKPLDPLTLDVWVRASAETRIYRDEETWHCSARKTGDRMELQIKATPRACVVRLHGVPPPRQVEVNSAAIPRLESAAELQETEQGWTIESPLVVSIKLRLRDGATQTHMVF
jgi:alpha-D-xyloside xylohydrolase